MSYDQYLTDSQRRYTSQAAEEARTVKAGGGRLYKLLVANVNASARYLYVFDNTASSGALLLPPIPVAASGLAEVTLPGGLRFSTALRFAASSTIATFTAAGANDVYVTAEYL